MFFLSRFYAGTIIITTDRQFVISDNMYVWARILRETRYH